MAEPAVNPGWRKSSYSDNGGTACIEAGHASRMTAPKER
jgi:hypothetical protein